MVGQRRAREGTSVSTGRRGSGRWHDFAALSKAKNSRIWREFLAVASVGDARQHGGMNNTTDIQARLDGLSSLGRAALALSCEGFDAAEMRRCAELMNAPPGSEPLRSLTQGQRKLGKRYLRRLEHAEAFQAQARENGLFTGEAKHMAFFGNRLITRLAFEFPYVSTWEELADKAEQGQIEKTPGLGKRGLDRMLRALIELMTAAELDGIDVSPAGGRLIEALLPPEPAPKTPRFRFCEACGARHRIAA